MRLQLEGQPCNFFPVADGVLGSNLPAERMWVSGVDRERVLIGGRGFERPIELAQRIAAGIAGIGMFSPDLPQGCESGQQLTLLMTFISSAAQLINDLY